MPEKMYTLDEVAEFLATTPRELRRYISEGKLPAIKIGKSWKVSESTIDKIQSGELVI
ncbi:DNA-binding protein [Methanofollis formosanus]|uniref:DNA-binding protein n=1 Tax=Methanofollis formosanus TaxID=299308 RepID=A0A8G1EFZ0_9EURY|nr:helix-turn-helix domain-containing protein [Methanofollis formosanus]QYZ78629.1 DNA-binding protein [Methanofollis formosanus]